MSNKETDSQENSQEDLVVDLYPGQSEKRYRMKIEGEILDEFESFKEYVVEELSGRDFESGASEEEIRRAKHIVDSLEGNGKIVSGGEEVGDPTQYAMERETKEGEKINYLKARVIEPQEGGYCGY